MGIFILGGCKKKDNNPIAIFSSWGVALNDDSPSFILDWNFPKKIIINNINNIGNISQIPDSTRCFMYYSFVTPSTDSSLINVNTITTILTKKLQEYNASIPASDTFGKNLLYIDNPFVSQNFLTIPFSYYYSNPNIKHMISLVYNADNPLWDKDTMCVEFKHNAKGDEGNYPSGTTSIAFNLNSQRPPIGIRKDSFFIKMSYTTTASLSIGSESKTIVIPAKWQ
ncbi:MAG: hypothetical protein ACRC0A_05385 [Chitinophagaceae bacterium]